MQGVRDQAANLRRIFRQDITVAHIAERLAYCDEAFDALATRRKMDELGFDVYGISTDGRVNQYVYAVELNAGICQSYAHAIVPSQLVSSSTPLLDLLPVLRNKEWVFVLEGTDINGIITWADMQKLPVRMMLFSMVSLLEMHLLELIRIHFPQDSWESILNSDERKKVTRTYERHQDQNNALDRAEYLDFAHKIKIVSKSNIICTKLLMRSDELASLLNRAKDLRNGIAHNHEVENSDTNGNVVDLAHQIDSLVIRCETALA